MEEENLYNSIGEQMPNVQKSQMFGKPCLKVGGKAFACFFDKHMVFKLTGDHHQEALSLDGSELFDPSKKGRSMKEWVQVPFHYKEHWTNFAQHAFDYVAQTTKK